MKENSSSGKMRKCRYCGQFYLGPCDGKDKGCQNKIYKDTGHPNYGLAPYVEPTLKKAPPAKRPRARKAIPKELDLF